MRVRWSKAAVRHLDGIFQHIRQDSHWYALRMVDRLTARSRLLGSFPEAGAIVEEYRLQGIRQVLVASYRIIYQIRETEVVVLAVIHAARLLPEVPPAGEP